MKVEGYLFGFVAVFLFACDIVYFYWSRDPTGSTAIAFSVGLAGIISYYLLFTARRMEARPEDRGDAEVSDGAGEVGFFSPHSHWPIALAAGAALTSLGFIFGWWLVVIGGGVLLLGVVGMLFEYYFGPEH